VRFLLGPAGSGKTWRCLDEARIELKRDPTGGPLLFLAPKQATFQIERQLLSDRALRGFTRLQITSLDRLAADTLVTAGSSLRLLSEEGRVMVLRALLSRHHGALRAFRSTARLSGFAGQLSLTLRDCRRYQLNPAKLRQRAAEADPGLADKLQDCAFLIEQYESWLADQGLQDPDVLMDAATDVVRAWPIPSENTSGTRLHSLWLDGFAEMTPQEITFLAALLPHSARSTLAFCLPPTEPDKPRGFDPWALVTGTYASLLSRLSRQPDLAVTVERLEADLQGSRFAHSPMLAHLEKHWSRPVPFVARSGQGKEQESSFEDAGLETGSRLAWSCATTPDPKTKSSAIRIVACPHPEAEAIVAAREILEHVQAGGRFRETAILVRSLEPYHAVLQRVLRRYEIPFFLDRRESVTHHPLAELTRYSLRTLAYHWQHEDWFGALKTGLLPAGADEVDLLENEALARGWEGTRWFHALGITDNPRLASQIEGIRRRVLRPLSDLQQNLKSVSDALSVTGEVLSRALLALWRTVGVAERLESWSKLGPPDSRHPAVHAAVWEQMQGWAENLALAFADHALSLREWLPIVESGLSGLTVGVIPPALDQVLVGAVDRSRNPNLRRVVVVGVHEGGFPAAPSRPALLTEAEHRQLESLGARLGTDARLQLAHERYYGYIAFTRASSRLVITWSKCDADDRPQFPSPFVKQLERLFPETKTENYIASPSLSDAAHACELGDAALAELRTDTTAEHPLLAIVCPEKGARRRQLERLARYDPSPSLSETTAGRLYGQVLRTSVSALEKFAACPFRFFVAQGLKAEERKVFVADSREQGSYQHEILARFHQKLSSEGRLWRDLTPLEARACVRQLAEDTAQEYRDGLFRRAPGAAFTARALAAALEDFVEVSVDWMRSYTFDPATVELGFGLGPDTLPAWTLELDHDRRLEFRGKVDRIDLLQADPQSSPLAVVVDYKSGHQALDELLVKNGIQLQLLAYLAVVRALPAVAASFGHGELEAAGVFYVTLRGGGARGRNRRAALTEPEALRRQAYQHRGRYRMDTLQWLDTGAPDQPSGQFHYRFNQDGKPDARCKDLLTAEGLSRLLTSVEDILRSMGRRILDGDICIDPYQHGQAKACDRCDYQSICRVEPWSQEFRRLQTSSGSDVPRLNPSGASSALAATESD
jgi:ATP-dependent helicase/nuclease subunit B